MSRCADKRGANTLAAGPGGPSEMVPGQHHPRMNMYIARAEAGQICVGMTTERADREALSAEGAAAELRQLASRGVTEPRARRAVLVAAGHGEPTAHRVTRAQLPGRLSRREADVLRLAVSGLTIRQIADRLYISTKTADHHIQHIYRKTGVSTRAAAALWATQNAVVS